MALTNVVVSPQVWIFIPEACAIFDKYPRSVQYAIWKDKVKARQARVGKTWMLELNSCIAYWGKPVDDELVLEIMSDVNDY